MGQCPYHFANSDRQSQRQLHYKLYYIQVWNLCVKSNCVVSLISYYSTFAEVNYTIDMLKFLYTIIETIMQSNCQQLQELSK